MITPNDLKEAALRVIESAHAEGIECRLCGSLGVEYYVGASSFSTRPAPAKDIDLITKSSSRRALQGLMKRLEWRLDESLLLLAEKRETYYLTGTIWTLDLYFDQIDGNHIIELEDRLGLAYPVIPLIDLLLTKLQRRCLRPVDEWDICLLLSLGFDGDSIAYFSTLAANNWSLYTTVTDNLRASMNNGCNASRLLTAAERSPKTLRWKTRAIVGRRYKWWREVYSTATAIGS